MGVKFTIDPLCPACSPETLKKFPIEDESAGGSVSEDKKPKAGAKEFKFLLFSK